MKLLHELLADRVRSDPTGPLVTYYAGGARTELSARSFANWVDKTANLITQELELGEGDRVRLAVADADPGHWMSLVWVASALQAGLELVDDPSAELTVTGPDLSSSGGRGELVACSLHPLGLGFDAPLPPPFLDFSVEARSQADVYLGQPPSADAAAWQLGERELDQRELVAEATAVAERVLVRPSELFETTLAALIGPLLGGGSVVVVAGECAPGELDRIRTAEQVTT